ncbi:response regulator [Bowmanella dokdonensis]|uniref:Response regulator transcription factor n=1 Tax=Bowmanella dokdonensis TaxID=751969 RepID=A0A939IQV6_9ALTE|nr:response regulator transcription factor [Bowmanella dokdonensis]MBN7825464.1 response regulator transcription factor [Bowmanella dokdonensis]
MKSRILVIDDEAQIRRFMRISLTAEGFDYFEAKTAAEGVAMASGESPDLIVLDLGLPDQDGYWVLRRLRQWSKVPVLVLTARDAEEEKVKLLEGGANDYLSKPFGVKELMARIRVLLRDLGSQEESPPASRLEFSDLVIDLVNWQAWLGGAPLSLTRKEFSLLSFLASRPGQLVTQQQLIEAIWGSLHVQDTHYVRILISQVRKKLGDDAESPRYILTEPGVGYRFQPDPDLSVTQD